jgi:ACS family hexuronate transporter-like MFS transporter
VKGRYNILLLLTVTQMGSAVIQQGFGVLGPLLIAEFHISKAQLGILFSAMFFGTTCFTALAGALTDRVGERRMIAISALLMTIALVAAASTSSYVWLVACLALFGIAYAGSAPSGTRAVLAWFDRDRGFAMAFRQTGVTLGGLTGALILPSAAQHFGGYRGALVMSAVLVAVPALIACWVYHDPVDDRPKSSQSFADILREMPALARDPRVMAICGTAISLVSLQQAMGGFLTVTNVNVVGLSPTTAGIAFACAMGAATFGRLFWGWLSDRFLGGERIGMLPFLALLGSVAALAVAALGPGNRGLAIPVAMLIGLGAAGWNGIQVAALGEIGGMRRAGSVIGIALTVIFGASAVAPVVFGAIADRTSLTTAWYTFAWLSLLGVIPPLWLKLRRPPVPQR